MNTRQSIVPTLSILAIMALLALGIGWKAPITEATAQGQLSTRSSEV